MARTVLELHGDVSLSTPLMERLIETIVRRIVACAMPERVVLFGSYARGDARPDSDLDLLVISRSDAPRFERAVPLYVSLSDIPLSMDIVVYRSDEIDLWRDVPQAFITTALREGRVLYEKT